VSKEEQKLFEKLLAERESLLQIIKSKDEKLDELLALVKAQSEQIAELLARLGTDSTNSSKPPSQDGPAARTRSLRGKGQRKPGGQAGRAGTTLEMAANPDFVIEYRPQCCGDCGRSIPRNAQPIGFEARQVFDIPEQVNLETTEHRLLQIECGNCLAITQAQGPVGVTRQVQYGQRINDLSVYLVAAHHIPLDRCSKLLGDVFGASISPATINKNLLKAAEAITNHVRPVITHILVNSPVAHADETGFKVAGKTKWAHSFSNPQGTWIEVHDKRGTEAIDDIGIIPRFTGTLVHDAWRPYDKYPGIRAHQLCCAHLQRELQKVRDIHDHPPGQWCWAEQTQNAISSIIANPVGSGNERHLILSALAAAPNDPTNGESLARKHAALRNRIFDRLDDYLRFTTNELVPATNNPAEQEVRMIKVKQKVSGGMRTLKGANAFAAIRSYLSTARKNSVKPLQAISTLTTQTPWAPALP